MAAANRRAQAAALHALYFPRLEQDSMPADEDGTDSSRAAMLDSLRDWVRSERSPVADLKPEDVIYRQGSVHLEWSVVSNPGNDGPFTLGPQTQWSRHPRQDLLDGLALCTHELLLEKCPALPDLTHTAERLRRRRLHVRIHNISPSTPMRSLRADTIGKLVAVRGSVIRVSSLRPMVQSIKFVCPRCGAAVHQPQQDSKFTPPPSCPAGGCRAKALVPDRRSATTRDYQKIRLQEVPDESNRKEFYGRVPRTVEVELLDELVDCCVPGDTLEVSGLVKSIEVPAEGAGRGAFGSNKPKCMYLLYIEAVSVTNSKSAGKTASKEEDGDDALNLSLLDLHAIAQVANEKRLFELLVASMCPSIFGHEVVKAGLALGLFGGSTRKGHGERLAKRSDIHVLVVGDPGMGKSQMLTATAALAPRGVYVCGNTTSSSGLTVTVVKDAAGIVCSLSARTAVLAAANPVGGHYNRAKTVSENLKLPANLLSRFDLIFVLLDRPNEAMDKLLSEHVMALHGGVASRGAQRMSDGLPAGGGGLGDAASQPGGLALRLRAKASEHEPIPAPLLRKYIAYARQYCHPVLSDEAHAVLHDFYMSLRKRQRGSDTVPITSRQLESLIRLSEARARMELREEVTRADALDAVEVVQETIFYDTFADIVGGMGDGGCSADPLACARKAPKAMPHARVLNTFVSMLEHEADARGDALFSFNDLKAIFERSGLTHARDSFQTFVEELNHKNHILKKGNGVYKLQVSGLTLSANR